VLAWVKKKASLVLPRGRFARSVALLAGGTALGQAITVLVSPILKRLYTPKDSGLSRVYTSIVGIVTMIASLHHQWVTFADFCRNSLRLCRSSHKWPCYIRLATANQDKFTKNYILQAK